MQSYLIDRVQVVNEGRSFPASVWVNEGRIQEIFLQEVPASIREAAVAVPGEGCWLLPGVIDCHVHFRDPGFPDKADFGSESRAAVAGGVTSVMDMPNTRPQTVSRADWEAKMAIAAAKSYCNYSAYIAATAENLDELRCIDGRQVCAIKLFLGSSTGNMLLNRPEALHKLFSVSPLPIVVHAESEDIIQRNQEEFRQHYGNQVPMVCHPQVRSEQACFAATQGIVQLAKQYDARLHVAHLSTAKELTLFEDLPLSRKRITCETCPQYLYFDDTQYVQFGARIKCNPAIKTPVDREALVAALETNRIDLLSTDHAPHCLQDKEGDALHAASGMPGVQYALPLAMELVRKGSLSLETLVEKMCHNPARLFQVEDRGFIRPGYAADLVLIRPQVWTLSSEDIQSRCAWSPYEGMQFTTRVVATWVNGGLAYRDGSFASTSFAAPLHFAR